MATVQKDKKLTDETWALLDQINNMKQMAGAASENENENDFRPGNSATLKLTPTGP